MTDTETEYAQLRQDVAELNRSVAELYDRLKFVEASFLAMSGRVRELERRAAGRHG